MPREIIDKDGNSIEVPTEEELQELRQKAELVTELEAKAGRTTELEQELEKLSDVSNLRKQRDLFKKTLEEKGLYVDVATGEVKTKESTPPQEQNIDIEKVVQEHYNQLREKEQEQEISALVSSEIAKASGGDEQVKKTIEAKYKLYSEGRRLSKEIAQELARDAASSVLGRRVNQVHEFARAGSGYGGSGAMHSPPSEKNERLEKGMELLKQSGYQFKKSEDDIKKSVESLRSRPRSND
jgi:hypothetical protein